MKSKEIRPGVKATVRGWEVAVMGVPFMPTAHNYRGVPCVNVQYLTGRDRGGCRIEKITSLKPVKSQYVANTPKGMA